MTRGSEPGTGISRAHSSGTASKPIARAATAGNSASRSSVAVKRQLTHVFGRERVAAMISCISSVVAARIGSASLLADAGGAAQGEQSPCRRFCQSGERSQAPSASCIGQAPASSGREAVEGRAAPKRDAHQRRDRCPTASHMRRTWRLRPSWIVSSIVIARRAGARARARSGRPRASRRARSARSVAVGERAAAELRPVGLRRPRSADGSARLASSPSLVSRISPLLSASRRPTGYSRSALPRAAGRRPSGARGCRAPSRRRRRACAARRRTRCSAPASGRRRTSTRL